MRAGVGASVALRWTRATVLALVAMLIGTSAHLLAGGAVPDAAVLVAVTLVVAAVAARFLGRPATRATVICLLAAGQAFIHTVLTALAGPHTSSHQMAAMHHHSDATTVPGLLMLGGHLVAAVTVGLWLAAGERATWTLILLAARPAADTVARIRLLVALAAAVPAGATYPCIVPVLADSWTVAPAAHCRPVTRRGPPARVAP